MKPLAWLELASDRSGIRPAFGYAYPVEIAGEPVTVATDSCRMHWVYEQFGDSPVALKGAQLNPEPDTAAAWAAKLPHNLTSVLDATLIVGFQVRAHALQQALKIAATTASEADAVYWLYKPGTGLLIHSFSPESESVSTLPANPVGADRGRPARACTDARYALNAVRLFADSKRDQRVTVYFGVWPSRGTACVMIGQPDRAQALIMQMDAKPGHKMNPFMTEWHSAPAL